MIPISLANFSKNSTKTGRLVQFSPSKEKSTVCPSVYSKVEKASETRETRERRRRRQRKVRNRSVAVRCLSVCRSASICADRNSVNQSDSESDTFSSGRLEQNTLLRFPNLFIGRFTCYLKVCLLFSKLLHVLGTRDS